MAPIASFILISLLLVPTSLAGPILPRSSPTTVDSVSASAAPSDVPPPVFTFGPSGLPHVSAQTTANAPTSSLVLEMDWLS